MRAVDLIQTKRDGGQLTREELAWLVQGHTAGEIPDYQMSAFLMAVHFRGMTPQETVWLTEAMMRSGEVLDLSSIPGPKIDKHSTGGVGDKVSLVLAPLVAALGVKVPMISGRGLGHTGGTLDKLEAIPGFRVNLSTEEFTRQVRDIGVAIVGQTAQLAPADRKTYALRDVTATVDSIPLIAASIMSKKLAEGIDGLVLDVKTGSGAFMRRAEDARALAKTMVDIGQGMGKQVVALITDMSQPLGRMVGNATEVVETLRALRGEGPEDLMEVTFALGAEMLRLADIERKPSAARQRLRGAIDDGRALRKFQEMVVRQGGSERALDELEQRVRQAPTKPVLAPASGFVTAIDTRQMGLAACILGAGRQKADDAVDHRVGYEALVKLGERVERGQPLVKVFYSDEAKLPEAICMIAAAYEIGEQPQPNPPLVYCSTTSQM
ncbi:MAG: thymidine phosphorylase [Planctomycetes bacterium]|nr:thymidine phosphorylase [Planctomycetota bacterium]